MRKLLELVDRHPWIGIVGVFVAMVLAQTVEML